MRRTPTLSALSSFTIPTGARLPAATTDRDTGKELCTCTKCKRNIVVKDGVERRGRLLSPRKVRQHQEEEAFRALPEEETEQAIEGTILLASAAPPEPPNPSSSLPVRSRDTEGQEPTSIENPSLTDGTVAGPASGTQSAPSTSSTTQASLKYLDADKRVIEERHRLLSQVQSGLHRHSVMVPRWIKLKFPIAPANVLDPAPEPTVEGHGADYHIALHWFKEERDDLRALSVVGQKDADRRLAALLRELDHEIARLGDIKEWRWDEEKARLGIYGLDTAAGPAVAVVKSDEPWSSKLKDKEPFIIAALFMTTALHCLAGVSRTYLQYMLYTMQAVIFGAFTYCNVAQGRPRTLTDAQAALLSSIPGDIRTVLKSLGLEPDFVRYAICPSCSCTYAPSKTSPNDPYPHHCTFKETDKEPCGTRLVYRKETPPTTRHGKATVSYEPIRYFPYRPPESWLQDMAERPGMMDLLAQAPRDAMDASPSSQPSPDAPDSPYASSSPCAAPSSSRAAPSSSRATPSSSRSARRPPASSSRTSRSSPQSSSPQPSSSSPQPSSSSPQPSSPQWNDFWDASAVRMFIGPDGKTLYCIQPEGSVHLVFSLFIDWFNPFGNKKAGKSHSIGAIYMACMNLPPHLRYRPENIYLVGVIPGPKEPGVNQLNHFLRPLVDDLLTLWNRGIILSQVEGRAVSVLVRAAVIPLVCDVPALRKAGGWAGHGATHFCSFCQLLKSSTNDLDREHWPRRTWKEHVEQATAWRDAPTEVARDALFEAHGLRWSELLRLEYWDPTRFAVVDAMHNLFLGELRHHCMNVWGVDHKERKRKGEKHSPSEQEYWLERVGEWVEANAKGRLNKIRKGYIVGVAEFNNIQTRGGATAKRAYVDALIEQAGLRDEPLRIPPPLEEATYEYYLLSHPFDLSRQSILDGHTLSKLREDIANTIFPSWMERPPRNFGDAGHGKLKADQWRTACTVSLLITLCRVWGSKDASARHRALLEHFVDLVCAVDLAARRSMTAERAKKFDAYMYRYLSTLKTRYQQHFVPNHHLSLHLTECLLLFGPVHAWWAFPFERYNGLLGALNTNNKSTDMPLTFLRYFYIGTKMRTVLKSVDWPDDPAFKRMLESFSEAFKDSAKGTRFADFLRPEDQATDYFAVYDDSQKSGLPMDIYEALLSRISLDAPSQFASLYEPNLGLRSRLNLFAQQVRNVARDGYTFATRKSGLRDSHIMFRDPTGKETSPCAGQIREIFLHSRVEDGGRSVIEPFLVVDEYEPLTERHRRYDPYCCYPDINTEMYYNKFKRNPRVLKLSDVLCHFAALVFTPEDIGTECIVVRSLDRS